ncbi:carbohydrate kinase family protein [Candidatus Shapirobacteria bacterium]|nr:carbohydrate kinase family protein [Candidatus Shapirobacteria bacterium]
MKKYDVISFGSAVLDVFLKSPDFRVLKGKTAFDQALLTIPYGVKSEVSDLVLSSGGGGTNTAVSFARLGLQTAVAARCGWDFAGKIVRQEIKKEKVADDFLVQLEGEKTDYSTILISPDGNRTILVWRGGTRLEANVLDFKRLNSFWFYIASLEGNLDLLEKLINHAQKNHIKIALNPGKREISSPKNLLDLCQKVDVLLLNLEEAKLLGDLSVLKKTMVVTTKGEKGVVVNVPGKGEIKMEAFKVKMVDQTGAGDAFGSGFIAGLVKEFPLEKALQLGVANGASVVEKIGAKQGLIQQSEMAFWLEKPLKYSW